MGRISLSKKVRFEILKRDQFTCQYCGQHAPNVILCVDHVHPVSLDGANNSENLITACEECNQGKSDTPLTASDIAELEKQIKKDFFTNPQRSERRSGRFPVEIREWMIEQRLLFLSCGARGLWVELLCFMAKTSPRYGYLALTDLGTKAGMRPVTDEEISRLWNGCDAETMQAYLAELLAVRTLERSNDGYIFNRRMVRYEELRIKRATSGKSGGLARMANRAARVTNGDPQDTDTHTS